MQRRTLLPGAGKFLKLNGNRLYRWLRYKGANDGSATVVDTTDLSIATKRTMKILRLSATSGIVVYQVTGADGDIKAKAFTVSGNTPTLGSAVTIATGVTLTNWDSAVVTSGKFVVGYSDGTNNRVTVKSYTVSGTSISSDASLNVITGSAPDFNSIGVFSSTKGVVHAANTAIKGFVIGSGSLTADSNAASGISFPGEGQMVNLDATHVMFTPTANQAAIITSNDPVVVGSSETAWHSDYSQERARLSELTPNGRVLMIGRDNSSPNTSTLTILTYSSTTVTSAAGSGAMPFMLPFGNTLNVTYLESVATSDYFMVIGTNPWRGSNRMVIFLLRAFGTDELEVIGMVQTNTLNIGGGASVEITALNAETVVLAYLVSSDLNIKVLKP